MSMEWHLKGKKQNDQSSQFEESNFGAVADQNKAIKSVIPTQIGSAQNVEIHIFNIHTKKLDLNFWTK